MEQDEHNVRITHDQDDFDDGQQYILTMRDQPLLADGDLNDNEDEMINVELNQNYRTKLLLKNKAKVTNGNKLSYDTNNFDDSGQLKKQSILDKYDVEEEEKIGMILNLKNNKLKNKQKQVSNLDKFQGGERNEMNTTKVFKSDFMLEDQSISLGGSKKFKKGKKRNQKQKQKLLENIDELLEDDHVDEDDLKTREERIGKLNELNRINLENQDMKFENYNKAVLKANLKTDKIHRPELEEDDDYLLVQKSIERQRKLQLAKQSNPTNITRVKKAEDALMSLLNESAEESVKKQNDSDFIVPLSKKPADKSKFSYL